MTPDSVYWTCLLLAVRDSRASDETCTRFAEALTEVLEERRGR